MLLIIINLLVAINLWASCSNLSKAQQATQSEGFSTEAENLVIMDYQSGEVLYQKNGYIKTHPSSMTKLMTLYILFNLIKNKQISLDQEFFISEKAWRTGGSKMFVPCNGKVSVENLIRGMIVSSGNDASVAVAENISGSVENFAKLMNQQAILLKMNNSNFLEPSGLPPGKNSSHDSNHYSSCYDLCLLARAIISEHPDRYEWFKLQEFTFCKIRQFNRTNSLLNLKNFKVDGLKTGHTDLGKYGVVVSATCNNRRLIIAINGCANATKRTQEISRALNFGFNNFVAINIKNAGEVVAYLPAWLGNNKWLPVYCAQNIGITMPKMQNISYKLSINYLWPLKAPITKNTPVAKLLLELSNGSSYSFNLLAYQDMPSSNFFGKIYQQLSFLLFGADSAICFDKSLETGKNL